jgi:hypothetical protein
MSKKFKVNDRVRVKATGEVGTVKGREVLSVDGTKHINIEYIVRVGDGFGNWKSYNRKELEPLKRDTQEKHTYTKVYDVVDGYKITMFTKVYSNLFNYVGRDLRMGYAIYSPEDEYDESIGVRIAKKRSISSPFCHMYSAFGGEFNEATVYALMDVKADYIKNNLDRFIKKSK